MIINLGDRVKLKTPPSDPSHKELTMAFKVVAIGTFKGEDTKTFVIQRESGKGHSCSSFRACEDAVYYHPKFADPNYDGRDLFYIGRYDIAAVISGKHKTPVAPKKTSNNLFNIDDL